MISHERLRQFTRGLRRGIPIAVGYVSAGTALGLVAQKAGITPLEGMFMSAIVFAGAGEFSAVSMLLIGASNFEIVFTNFILNFRYFLQCSTLSRRLEPGCPPLLRVLIGHTTADESFSMATIEEQGAIDYAYMLGLNVVSVSFWIIGTGIGCYGASWIPADLQSSMGISLFGMFIGMLVPAAKKNMKVLFVISVSILVNTLMRWLPCMSGINMGWSILAATCVGALSGALIFPVKEDNQ